MGPDPVTFFSALGRVRPRKEVAEAKRKTAVEEEEQGRGKSVSALKKGAAHTPRDKPMRRKLRGGDVQERS